MKSGIYILQTKEGFHVSKLDGAFITKHLTIAGARTLWKGNLIETFSDALNEARDMLEELVGQHGVDSFPEGIGLVHIPENFYSSKTFKTELTCIINIYGKDSQVNIPDNVLAEMICEFIDILDGR